MKRRISLLTAQEQTLIIHDLGQLWKRRTMRFLVTFIPIFLVLLLPVAFLVSAALIPGEKGQKFPGFLMNILAIDTAGLNYQQLMFAAFNKLLSPMLVLIVTIICSVSVASCAFIMEKENQTMETLMLSAMDRKAIFNAKVSESVIFSVFLSLISFVVFLITMIVGGSILNMPFSFRMEWPIIVLVVIPALSLFCTVLISLLVPRIHTLVESLQTLGYFIVVLGIFYLLQFAGVWNINAWFYLILGVVLFIVDFILYNASARRFTPELILQEQEQSV